MNLYLIGGTSRAGKSTIAQKIREKRIFTTPSPDDLCRPIVKNLFVGDIPEGTSTMLFEGATTFGPQGARQSRKFDFAVPIASIVVPAVPPGLLVELPTDYTRFIIRAIFVGGNYGLNSIGFKGKTNFLSESNRPVGSTQIMVPIQGEEPVVWKALSGLIADYDRADRNDLVIEGVALTPENIDKMEVNNFKKKVAFVGFNDEAHAERLLEYFEHNPDENDHLYQEMKRSGKTPEEFMREWMRGMVAAGNDLRERANKFGYPYFDMTRRPYDEQAVFVAGSLMSPA